jgi:hypothetical protein
MIRSGRETKRSLWRRLLQMDGVTLARRFDLERVARLVR